MLQKWSRYTLLELFFNSPRKKFLVRELSRMAKLAATSIRLHLKVLLAEGMIIKDNEGLYPSFAANTENPSYKLLRQQNTTLRLHEGLINHLQQSLHPTCIILFGSASRGEDHEESDIDLFVQAEKEKIDLTKYERVLHRKINLLFEPNLTTIGPELLNNLANGTVLYGYLKVK